MYYKGDIPEITDGAIKLFLTKAEQKRLNVLTRSVFVMTLKNIAANEPHANSHSHIKKRLAVSREIIALYTKAHVDEDSMYKHWNISYNDQMNIRYQMNRMPANPYQDNKTYRTSTGGGSCWPTVRYPKKKRKTAWKRFYKLFPELKPEVNQSDTNIV